MGIEAAKDIARGGLFRKNVFQHVDGKGLMKATRKSTVIVLGDISPRPRCCSPGRHFCIHVQSNYMGGSYVYISSFTQETYIIDRFLGCNKRSCP